MQVSMIDSTFDIDDFVRLNNKFKENTIFEEVKKFNEIHKTEFFLDKITDVAKYLYLLSLMPDENKHIYIRVAEYMSSLELLRDYINTLPEQQLKTINKNINIDNFNINNILFDELEIKNKPVTDVIECLLSGNNKYNLSPEIINSKLLNYIEQNKESFLSSKESEIQIIEIINKHRENKTLIDKIKAQLMDDISIQTRKWYANHGENTLFSKNDERLKFYNLTLEELELKDLVVPEITEKIDNTKNNKAPRASIINNNLNFQPK